MLTSTKKLERTDGQIYSYHQIVAAPEAEDSDEERELTNLNWLLRNQNLSWSKTIDVNSEDDINNQPNNRNTNGNEPENITQNKLKLFENGAQKNMGTKTFNRNLVISSNSTKQASGLLKRPTPAERYDIFIGKIKRDLEEYEKSAYMYKTDVTHKPPFNYSHIIGMAMLENGRVTLQQICAWIESKFAFFRVRKKWNNSIRHNLSLHHCFRNRKREEKGKGGFWELGVDPKKCDRKRIRNRKSTQSKLNQTSKVTKNTKQNPVNGEYSQKRLLTNEGPTQTCNRKNIDTSSPYQIIADPDVQLDTLTLTEVEVGLGLPLPNAISPRIHDPDGTFLYPDTLINNDTFPQYELGTIIISTTGLMEEPLSLNSTIGNKLGCSNLIYTEDEIPTVSENIIISSHKMDSNREANEAIALITPMPPSSEITNSFTINCDYSNFRPYMDVVDEPFNYLHSSEIGRNEDILDNLLDVCVRDY